MIYGAGHAPLLRQFAQQSGYFEVVDPLRYLAPEPSMPAGAPHSTACNRRAQRLQCGMRIRFLPIVLLVATFAAMLAACSHAPTRNPMATWVPSPNHGARHPILIVIHATEQDSVAESLDTLRTPTAAGR